LKGSTGWVVVRMGACMHYAVPRILHRAGRLERLYTDFYYGDLGTGCLSWVPKKLRGPLMTRVMNRYSADLPRSRVYSYPLFGLEYYLRQLFANVPETKSRVHLSAGTKFGRMVRRSGFGGARAVYTFTTAAFEVLKAAKEKGLFSVVEQTIAPRSVEEELLSEEFQRYPGWELPRVNGLSTKATIEVERQEWELADLIICGSEFVEQGVARVSGPAEKCVIVPYGVDCSFARVFRTPHKGPLRVLSMGEAGLRKGIGYACETARLLGHKAEFRWVGPIAIGADARAQVERHIRLFGAVPRSEVVRHLEWADVFFMPSVCEGSATVTYEALMSGLPVVTTPNTGSLVLNGVDGFIVPIRDPHAMADRLRRLQEDAALLARMRSAAGASHSRVSLQAYAQRLLQALYIGSDNVVEVFNS
jgi:glycosyltransferase involved in cell wall biosynthesis